ncbi:ATP-dependent 6-phosphofructokinase 7 [Gracilariopsis chorda]|uniref:ATP-dependent 6-phosphofructokinase 7 n=1 Tax=Gracilariopsis chorda TaxID=448386 RepID=A0A2V3IET5_9FLOR|nr:ATP-dependent 6-phosphofructokinase 7 [Gracilariopsis chorda]|eukprot:PXF40573.1 ATP-dependent 6-phosphofructokinase 7 [Gracilariopsis chorda]
MSRPPTQHAPIVRSNTLEAVFIDPDDPLQSRQDLPKVIKHARVTYDDTSTPISSPRLERFSKIIFPRPSHPLQPARISEWTNIGSFPSPLQNNPSQLNLGLSFVGSRETILVDIISDAENTTMSRELVRAGPRKELAFHPSNQARPCIVTCGGLCPGLNSVIRELVMTLKKMYRVSRVDGIPFGYRGFYSTHMTIAELTEERVCDIHHEGGSIIGSSRGGHDTKRICDSIVAMGYNQIFIIGGDGTHRGAVKIFEELKRRRVMASVVGIPKTIDNDIALIDKSFGFDTAVEEAQRSIKCAKIEAKSAINGIGLVKLMGRHSGQIAMFATLASRDVDCCLIPEVHFELDGKAGLFQYIEDTLRRKGHMVIVVAEGAGLELIEREIESSDFDESGNKKLSDVGLWLKTHIVSDFRMRGREINLKLIDPTYEIRSVPANASDNLHCSLLAQSAVHGAMHGFSGFSVGMINTHFVLIPMEEICRRGRTKVDVKSRMWHRVIATTMQPSLSGESSHHGASMHGLIEALDGSLTFRNANSNSVFKPASQPTVFEPDEDSEDE